MKFKITEEELKAKEKRIDELRNIDEENLQKKVKIYRMYLKELNTLTNFMKKQRYYFTHPDYNEITTIGPILGKNKKKNTLYIYDINDDWVKGVNMYYPDEEPEKTTLYHYFQLNDFEEAIKGLLGLLDYQDNIIKQLEEENKISKLLIEKYSSLIEEEHC